MITYKGAKLDNTSMTRQELETSVGGWGGLSGDIGEDWFPAGSGGGEASAVLSQG